MRHKIAVGWIVALALAIAASTSEAQEAVSFVTAHRRAEKLAADKGWARAVRTYGSFATSHSKSEYAALASIIRGIILRRELKKPDEAWEAFGQAAKAPDTTFGRKLSFLALSWQARLQMERIDAALRQYYVRKVEYPNKLEELVEQKLIARDELVDPWGNPFSYRPKRLKMAPKITRQSYTLKSTQVVGESRNLKRFLKESAAFSRKFQMKGMIGSDPITVILSSADKPKKSIQITEQSTVGTMRALKVTQGVVVLVDRGMVAVVTR